MISTRSRLLDAETQTRHILRRWCNEPKRVKATMIKKSHPTQYKGELIIEGHCLTFRGQDLLEDACCEEVISFEEIIDIILPFDERLNIIIDPLSCSRGPVPFIIRYQTDNVDQTVYFNT